MKESIKNIKSWMLIWVWILFMLFLWWIAYTAWLNVENATTWSQLKSESWNNLLTNVESLKSWTQIPTWLISAFADSNCPSGWIPADWTSWTPDLRWVFIRWANSFDNWLTSNARDEDRSEVWQDKVIPWSYNLQGDAIRNITGTMLRNNAGFFNITETKWAFDTTTQSTPWWGSVNYTAPTTKDIIFNASNVVPTWKDNRPKNVALIYCVKQ